MDRAAAIRSSIVHVPGRSCSQEAFLVSPRVTHTSLQPFCDWSVDVSRAQSVIVPGPGRSGASCSMKACGRRAHHVDQAANEAQHHVHVYPGAVQMWQVSIFGGRLPALQGSELPCCLRKSVQSC